MSALVFGGSDGSFLMLIMTLIRLLRHINLEELRFSVSTRLLIDTWVQERILPALVDGVG